MLHTDSPLLVLAGAGSGKTGVITHKIVHLVRNEAIQARHIAAVTFTNKAAREMKSRVSSMMQSEETRGLRVSTFHNLGLNILRRDHKALGYKSGFSIFDAQDSAALIRELGRKEHDATEQIDAFQWRISDWKNAMVHPDHALSHAADEQEAACARLYALYNRHLKAYNALDFDDLILQPVRLFQEHPEVLQAWRERIRYLLVDEYQDTNACQYDLVKLLVGDRGTLTVVGDDDQSIYAWRGARPENLAQLQEDFPTLKVIKLEQNYRSMGRILKAANELIANNPHLFDKSLWSDRGYGDPIRVLRTKDADNEAQRVVSEILHHKFIHKTRDSDFAILYRSNHQARLFEQILREHRIPYHLSGGTSFFERSEIKDLLSYLRLLANPDDDAAFLRIVNTPRREIGASTLEKLGAYANSRERSLFAASFEIGLEETLKGRGLNNLRTFTEWLTNLSDRVQREEPVEVVKDLIRDINYEAWLQETSASVEAAERRIKNVDSLLDWLKRMREDQGPNEGLAEMVSQITLLDILDRQDEEDGGDRVSLMTLHTAKGLEFPHVFLVGVEEEILPHRNSLEDDAIEEERRLAYVGVTRAQKTLTITFAAKRRRYGEVIICQPSRFIEELPQDDLQWEGRGEERPPEERKQRGRAHIANLRGMLD